MCQEWNSIIKILGISSAKMRFLFKQITSWMNGTIAHRVTDLDFYFSAMWTNRRLRTTWRRIVAKMKTLVLIGFIGLKLLFAPFSASFCQYFNILSILKIIIIVKSSFISQWAFLLTIITSKLYFNCTFSQGISHKNSHYDNFLKGQ